MDDRVKAFVDDVSGLMSKYGMSGTVDVQTCRIRDGFWNKNREIWDSSEGWYEKVTVNKKKWIQHEYDLRMDFDIRGVGFVQEAVDSWAEEKGIEDVVRDDGETTLETIKAQYPEDFEELLDSIEDEIAAMDYWELEEYLEPLYGIEDPHEELDEFERLAYWTTYFTPSLYDVDEDLAWECGLFPFEYEGEDYVALGGCGMDLSPALDAYQALAVGSVPSDSAFLKPDSHDYAKYVVGEKVFDRVMAAITCPPVITVTTHGNEDRAEA